MTTERDLGSEVRTILVGLIPSSWRDVALHDDTDLLAGGIGLDSTGLLEVLLACEDAFGVELPAEDLLGDERVTVGMLVAYITEDIAANGGAR